MRISEYKKKKKVEINISSDFSGWQYARSGLIGRQRRDKRNRKEHFRVDDTMNGLTCMLLRPLIGHWILWERINTTSQIPNRGCPWASA